MGIIEPIQPGDAFSSCADHERLIQASRDGDLRAFSIIVKEHQTMVRAFLAERLSSPDEAEDLAQEVFITAYRKLDEFEIDCALGPWLRGIAFNHLRNYRRKFRAKPIGGISELQHLLDLEFESRAQAAQEAPRMEALRECLKLLDGPSLEIIQAKYVAGETVREIQKRTKRGYSALTMQLHRVRSALAQCIENKLASAN